MKRIVACCITACLGFAGAVPSAAQTPGCRLASPPVVELAAPGYEVARATEVRQSITVQVTGEAGCDFVIGLSSDAAGGRLRQLRGDTQNLAYLLSASASGDAVLGDLPVASASELLRGRVAAGGVAQLTLWATLPARQRVAPGIYRDTLRVNLYGSGERILDSRSMSLQVRVLPMLAAELEVGGASGPFGSAPKRLDFGEISHGARGEINLAMDANVAYSVSMQSRERGMLRNRAQRDAAIPYRASVDGRPIPLEAPFVWNEGAGTRVHRVVLEIGAVERVLAGTYEDAITLTISAR